eukprot:403356505
MQQQQQRRSPQHYRQSESNDNNNQQQSMNLEEYHLVVQDLQRLFMAVQNYKKRHSESFFFSLLQTLFFIFCSLLFLVLHWQVDFILEIAFLPLFVISIKDIVVSIKLLRMTRKIQIEFKGFVEENYLNQIPSILENLMILLQFIVLVICFSSQTYQSQKLLPLPYTFSLIFRWIFPSFMKCFIIHKSRDKELEQAYLQSGGSMFCFYFCIDSNANQMNITYQNIISFFIRLSILALFMNVSLKLTGSINWSIYILLWPYYILLGMSLIFSCGSLLLLFNWLCQKLNQSQRNNNSSGNGRSNSTFNSRFTIDEESENNTNNTQSVFGQNQGMVGLSQIMLNGRERGGARGIQNIVNRAARRERDQNSSEQRSQISSNNTHSQMLSQPPVQRNAQDQGYTCSMVLYLALVLNGLTFSLVVILIGAFNFFNNTDEPPIVPVIETLIYVVLTLIMTSVCFRQLVFWKSQLIKVKLNMQEINKIHDRIENFQREMEEQIAQGQDGYRLEIRADQLNTLQENLTRVNMDTVEDLPFSKFLVRISQSYYQTIGKFAKSLFTNHKINNQRRQMVTRNSKKRHLQKYKNSRLKVKDQLKGGINGENVRRQQIKNQINLQQTFQFDALAQKVNETDVIDILSIPEEVTSKKVDNIVNKLNRYKEMEDQDPDYVIESCNIKLNFEDEFAFDQTLDKIEQNNTSNLALLITEINQDNRKCITTKMGMDEYENQYKLDIEYGFMDCNYQKSPNKKCKQIDSNLTSPLKPQKQDEDCQDSDRDTDEIKKAKIQAFRKLQKKMKRCYSADSCYDFENEQDLDILSGEDRHSNQSGGFDKNQGKKHDKSFEKHKSPYQRNQSECMLCLTELSNCVLMDCGHSNICFDCAMRLAIKSRGQGKPPLCHLCREPVQYALKIQVQSQTKDFSSDQKDQSDCKNQNKEDIEEDPKAQKKFQKMTSDQSSQYVKILSYVDMKEGIPKDLRFRNRRRLQNLPKFKEHIITADTKWQIENADFSALMNEFRVFEKRDQNTNENQNNTQTPGGLEIIRDLKQQNQTTLGGPNQIVDPDIRLKNYFDLQVQRYYMNTNQTKQQTDWGRRRNSQ